MDKRSVRFGRTLGFLALASLIAAPLQGLAATATAGQILISEFRLRGTGGPADEYIVLYNNSGADHTVQALSGSGYGVAASDGVTRCSIPNGTVMPSKGAFLCVNNAAGGYSLANYPGGNGVTATADASYTIGIDDNKGIAVFNNNSGGGSYSLANRLDAVGSTSEVNTLYKEGTGLPPLIAFSIDYAFFRDLCGKGGSVSAMGSCPALGTVKDTNNNAADFIFADTGANSAGPAQHLGTPSPRNLSSPLTRGQGSFSIALLDPCVASTASPNMVRDFTSNPGAQQTFGTLDHRLTITNGTGGTITRLRYRIVDLSTFPAPSGTADLRMRTSGDLAVTVDRAPCGAGTSTPTVRGTTLEQPPTQPNSGALNSTLSSGTVSLATPLAAGASIDVRFLMGVQQSGAYKLGFIIESLPGGSATYYVEGCTDVGICSPPVVSTINRASANPTNATSVNFAVAFNQVVTGVDAADFALTTTGLTGASITGVSGSGGNYTVTANTGTGSGTIRLDLVDNDSITSVNGPLGGAGAGNGNVTAGQVYTIDKSVPTVTITQATGQVDPTAVPSITFTVLFSEGVTGFSSADVSLAGSTAPGPLVAAVTGSGAAYTVTVTGMSGAGVVVASIPAGAVVDTSGNSSLASTSVDNTVTYGADPLPSVTVNQAPGQADPASAAPITFAVQFSEPVTGFSTSGILFLGSTAPGTLVATITGSGASYTVSVSGMTGPGDVVVSVNGNAALDASLQPNTVSTSTDNVVAYAHNPPRLANISSRAKVLTGDDVMIGGFVIGGSTSKSVVVRARGPSLASFGIANYLANPVLQLLSGPTVIASNDDYTSATNLAQLQASGFAPAIAQDAAILMTLAPGAYTAIVSGVGSTTGVGIIEVFEVDALATPLINIATRGRVMTGDDVMIGGFVIQGSGPQTVVIRARGPSLIPAGVADALTNPTLQVFSGPTPIANNDDWGQASNAAAIQASGFAPSDSRESAVLMTLAPGAYTAIVSGVSGATGVAIVEVFTVP